MSDEKQSKVTIVIIMILYLCCWHVTLGRQNMTVSLAEQISKGNQVSQVSWNNPGKQCEKSRPVYGQENKGSENLGLP